MNPIPALAVASLLSSTPELPASAAAPALVLVRIRVPWWAPRLLVRRRFVQAVPDYARAPGLLRKAFTISEAGEFGGLYLWRSRADADAWFDARWHARVRERYGQDADVLVLESAIDLPGPARADGEDVGHGALRGGAHALLLAPASGTIPDPAALARALGSGLLSVTVGTREGRAQAAALFVSREAARAALTAGVEAALGGSVEVTGFEAPVLLRNAP